MSLEQLRTALPTNLERGEVDAALYRLAREPDVSLIPESNQKTLTEQQRTAATHFGGQSQHCISIRRPFDQAAADRAIRDPRRASDDDLQMAQRAPRIPSSVYDEIRVVVKQRATQAAPQVVQELAAQGAAGGPDAVLDAYWRLPDEARVAAARHAGIAETGGLRIGLALAKLFGRDGGTRNT